MKSASRRSFLQARILLRLEQGPARTVSEIAVAVDAQRPSVSRSLKTLREDELVERKRNGWVLTLAGEEEAKRCSEELSRSVDSIRRTFKGITTVQLTKTLNPIPNSLVNGILGNYIGINSTDVMAGAISSWLPKMLDNKHATMLADRVSLSLAPLMDTQRLLSGAIAQSVAVPAIGLAASQTNALVARAIEDIHTVLSASAIRVHGFDKVLYPGVLRDIQHIGTSYRSLLREATKNAAAVDNLPEIEHSWSRMLVPSSTVANFTHSIRSEVSPNPEFDGAALPHTPHRENRQETLKILLTGLNPELVERWEGSWQVLRGSNPDRLSQAAFSYRELIRMVLDELAPDVEVDRSQQGSKRKMQARQVLEGREGDFAGAMVDGLPRLYDFFSKSAHTSYRNEVAVEAGLMAGDGLLLMLLSSRQDPELTL